VGLRRTWLLRESDFYRAPIYWSGTVARGSSACTDVWNWAGSTFLRWAHSTRLAGRYIGSAREVDGHLHVEVYDHGAGLPEGFDIDQPRASLGFKVITGMVRQLQGHLTLAKDRKATHFLLDLPILSQPDEFRSA
jgi:hypothetical protein